MNSHEHCWTQASVMLENILCSSPIQYWSALSEWDQELEVIVNQVRGTFPLYWYKLSILCLLHALSCIYVFVFRVIAITFFPYILYWLCPFCADATDMDTARACALLFTLTLVSFPFVEIVLSLLCWRVYQSSWCFIAAGACNLLQNDMIWGSFVFFP